MDEAALWALVGFAVGIGVGMWCLYKQSDTSIAIEEWYQDVLENQQEVLDRQQAMIERLSRQQQPE